MLVPGRGTEFFDGDVEKFVGTAASSATDPAT